MEILQAFDLIGTYRGTADLVGCSPNTVKRAVTRRDAGLPPVSPRTTQARVTDAFTDRIVELVTLSQGHIQAKKVYEKLRNIGYTGSQRTIDYAVRAAKDDFQRINGRVHKPWIPEPGLWAQYDFADGPVIDDVATTLFIAWLPWSRYRFVVALLDRKTPSVMGALDRFFRHLGGVPTYLLTDNEKTVTTGSVCNLPVRNREIVSFADWYSTTVHTCVPYDPASKGGVENAVKVAKNDLVPAQTNLLDTYTSFADLDAACDRFNQQINATENTYGDIPADQLDKERSLLHTVPTQSYPIAVGQVRTVGKKTPMITYEKAMYSVPYQLRGTEVFVRDDAATGSIVISRRTTDQMITQVAKHPVTRPGQYCLTDSHFPDGMPTGPLERKIVPKTDTQKQFIALGAGAENYLRAATAAGIAHLNDRLELIVSLISAWGADRLNNALAVAATSKRFLVEDITSIMDTTGTVNTSRMPLATTQNKTYSQGTTGWAEMKAAAA